MKSDVRQQWSHWRPGNCDAYKNVELTAAKEMKRGTLLTTTSGKVAATAKAGVADCILAEDTDSKAKVATVYISGRFNREN